MLDLKQEVLNFCRTMNIRLNTDLGQHYLIDEFVLEEIIIAANVQPNDTVVEVGAGIGILTRELLRKTSHVTSIEIDSTIIPYLKIFLELSEGVTHKPTIIQDDALKVAMPSQAYKVVANIPYHITSPLLRHCFFSAGNPPSSMTLLIQKEVAEKICSKKESSVLQIMVQLFGTPEIVCHVPAKCFMPPPKVESSVIHIACFKEAKASLHTIDEILTLAKIAFSQKRKMLRNTLGSLPYGLALLEACNIAADRRPQTLTIQDWIALADARSAML